MTRTGAGGAIPDPRKTDPGGRRKRDPHCAGERGAFLCDLASALSKKRTKYDLPLHHKGIRRPRRSRSRKQDLAVRPVSGACKRQSGGAAAPTAPCRALSRTAAANITLLWSSCVFSEISAGRKKARGVFHQRAGDFSAVLFQHGSIYSLTLPVGSVSASLFNIARTSSGWFDTGRKWMS